MVYHNSWEQNKKSASLQKSGGGTGPTHKLKDKEDIEENDGWPININFIHYRLIYHDKLTIILSSIGQNMKVIYTCFPYSKNQTCGHPYQCPRF